MIVLTAGPASLVRLMRRDGTSQPLAPRPMDEPQDGGAQARSGARPEGGVYPPSL